MVSIYDTSFLAHPEWFSRQFHWFYRWLIPRISRHAARLITEKLRIPTIGIGCGENTCDGEIAVITDVIGSYPWFVPPFAKPEADIAASTRAAAEAYVQRVVG